MTRAGFSLLELLVVLAVVLVLTGILIPAMASVREQANRMICSSYMRQIGLATMMYTDDHDSLPPSEYIVDGRQDVQELMAAHSGEGDYADEGWQGFGHLFNDYIENAEVFYCPSHEGEHSYDQYASRYEQYDNVPFGPPALGAIYTNYQYAGATDWSHDGNVKRDLLDSRLVLATDGLRTWADFNHRVGMNVLKADISVNWRQDTSISYIRQLLQGAGQGQVADLAAYEDIWNIVDPE